MSAGLPLTPERRDRWQAVQPPRWRFALVPVVLLVLLVVLETAMSSEGGCTVQRPCGTDWASALEIPLLCVAPFALLWWPTAGAVLSILAAGTVAVVEVLGGFDGRVTDFGSDARWLSLGFPGLLLLAVLVTQWQRRAQSAAAQLLLADVPRATYPGPVPATSGWTWRELLALVLLAAGTASLLYAVVHGRQVAGQQARAPHVVGEVVGHSDDGYVVTVAAGDRRWDIDTIAAADYPVGSEQEILLLDEDTARLAVEPYDPAGWGALALFLALPGGLLWGRSRVERGALQRLLTEPQPVHAVQLGFSWDGTQVLCADASKAPLLQLDLLPVDLLKDDSAWSEDPERDLASATLYGTPRRGELLAVVLDDGLRLLPTRPARRGDPAWRETWVEVATTQDSFEEPAVQATASELAAWQTELLRPEWWRLPLGVVFTAGAVVAAFFIGRGSDGVFTTLWRCALAASFAFDGLVHLATRVQLTTDGLVHDGPTTRRTVPWKALERLTVADGDIVLAHVGDEVLPLTWLPHRPQFGGKARRREWAQRWAAVLAAQVRQAPAATNLTVRTEPRLHAAVLAIAFTIAVLAGLWSRGAL